MSSDENQSVIPEVAPPSDAAEQPAQQTEPQEAPPPAPIKATDEEHNWREVRRSMDELHRRNEELERRIQAKEAQSVPQADELANLRDDDIVTVQQAKKLAERHAKTVAEKVIKDREAATLSDRITAIYPDFDHVVSPENVETLRTQEPELYAGLQRLADDPLSQAKGAYKLLKKLGLGEMSEDMARNKAKIAENSKKPVSVQSVTKQSSAIGDVHKFDGGLTPEMKKRYNKEMLDAIKAG